MSNFENSDATLLKIIEFFAAYTLFGKLKTIRCVTNSG